MICEVQTNKYFNIKTQRTKLVIAQNREKVTNF
jgi:hypothetical protein